jgi:hypothetical protein
MHFTNTKLDTKIVASDGSIIDEFSVTKTLKKAQQKICKYRINITLIRRLPTLKSKANRTLLIYKKGLNRN